VSRLGNTKWAEGFVTSSRALVARGRPQPALDEKREVSEPLVASSKGHLASSAAAPSVPEEIVVRRRPSGMPGPLMLGGHIVVPRLLE
jgi:hypothetical protein